MIQGKPPAGDTIALASDHGGWDLKEEVRKHLGTLGYSVRDFSLGDRSPVDYPDVGLAAAEEVREGRASMGILICGTGLGMSILANKLPGLRATLCHDTYSARMSRAHNDSNILVMGGRVIGPELAREVVDVFIKTPFEGGRHLERLLKITDVERSIISGSIKGAEHE